MRTANPISFDLIGDVKTTSRFVIVDNYDIAGGGIITEDLEPSNYEGEVIPGQPKNPNLAEFEKEFKNLIAKYFPHWDINL